MSFLLRTPYLVAVVGYIVAVYLLCAFEHYKFVDSQWISWLVNKQMLTNEESSFFEVLSGILWCIASLLFIYLFRLSLKSPGVTGRTAWIGFYCVLSVFAFGEEISWGDHLLDYSHDLEIVKINSQHEANIHNINFAQILDISPNSAWHRYIKNITYLANPLFYLVLAFFWGLLPLIKMKCGDDRWALLSGMPTPSLAFVTFLFIHSAAFIFIDVALFNVGQVYEMFIGFAAIIVALDMLKADPLYLTAQK